jgi:uncharacterized protein YkwD
LSLSRRHALVGLAAAGVLPACADAADVVDRAPPAADPEPWIAYERRLQARLRDAGGGRFNAEAERAVLAATNRVRVAGGVGPLAWDDELALAARAHAADLARRDVVAHVSDEGFDPNHRFWLLARRTAGSPSENIAFHRGSAPASPAHLMEIWRKSPQHWTNLLRRSHTHAAFGLVRAADRTYLVGLYQAPAARFTAPVPFRPDSEAQMKAALAGLPAGFRAHMEPPEGMTSRAGLMRVVQAVVRRDMGQGRYLVNGGPIFILPPDVEPHQVFGDPRSRAE